VRIAIVATGLAPAGLTRAIFGFIVSSLGGAFVLWLLIDKAAWAYVEKDGIQRKPKRVLTVPLGICERISYTGALLLGFPAWIGVWIAIKVAAQWQRWQGAERVTYNVFLIGNLLSIFFGFLGAWIAAGRIPELLAG
jgi:hypothetical protein